MALNQRLKSLRLERQVTQKRIAEAIGINTATVQKFEYGTAKPKFETLIKLADFFDVSLDYLACRTDNPKMA